METFIFLGFFLGGMTPWDSLKAATVPTYLPFQLFEEKNLKTLYLITDFFHVRIPVRAHYKSGMYLLKKINFANIFAKNPKMNLWVPLTLNKDGTRIITRPEIG